MKKETKYLTVLSLISLCSCSHLYYAPNSQNVPLFKEKNEFRGAISIGQETSLSPYTTFEVQGAYSVTSKLAVMANFMSVNGGDELSKSWAKGRYLEGAFGYYKPINKFGVFEIYGGFGTSKQHHEYDSIRFQDKYDKGNADLSFNKIFIQPSIGLTYNAFDIAFSSRINRIYFYDISTYINNPGSRQFSELDYLGANKIYYLFEPAITIRGGWKYVKVQLQYVYSKNLTHYENNSNFYYQPNFGVNQISLGMYVSIAERHRKM